MIPQPRERLLFPRLNPSFRRWWIPLLLCSELALQTAADARETGDTRVLAAQSNTLDRRHGTLPVEQSQFLRSTNSLDTELNVLSAGSDQKARATARRTGDNDNPDKAYPKADQTSPESPAPVAKPVLASDPTPGAVPDNAAGNDPATGASEPVKQPEPAPSPAPSVKKSTPVKEPKDDPPVAQPTDPPKDPPADPPTDSPTKKAETSPLTPAPKAKPVTEPVPEPKNEPIPVDPAVSPDAPTEDEYGCDLGVTKDCQNCKKLAKDATGEDAKWTCVWKEATGKCEAGLLADNPKPIWCKGDPTKSPSTKPLKPEPGDEEGNNMILFAAIGAGALISAILVCRRCTTSRSPSAVSNPALGKYQGVYVA
jgi:hypothetical protein